jgi:hypothetical protein
MHWHRDAYLDHLRGGHTPREMVVELFGLLIGTEDHWRDQGASEAEIDLTAFAWDTVDQIHVPMQTGPLNGLVEELLREDDRERVVRDAFGRTTLLPKRAATIALPLDFPVAEPRDWERIRHWFRPDPQRVDADAVAECARQREAGAVTRVFIWGAYDILRQLMGDENACVALIEEPEMVGDILRTIGDMQADCIDKITPHLPLDILFVHEDFAGKSGPMAGPDTVRSLFNPYYRRMWELVQPAGARIFDLDSDGFIDPVVDALLEGGINCLHPVEPAAGSDIVRLRKRYGRELILRGGIDKFALAKGRAAIDAELDYRLDPCLRGGGTMFGLDHRIPATVTIEAYRYYVSGLRRRLGLPPCREEPPGWGRMA